MAGASPCCALIGAAAARCAHARRPAPAARRPGPRLAGHRHLAAPGPAGGETSSSYDSLFLMLRAERFDYFPRAVLEANAELQHMHIDDLTLDRHLVLHYPTALYFFFATEAATGGRGAPGAGTGAGADGSFDRLFQQHHADDLRRARLDQRQSSNSTTRCCHRTRRCNGASCGITPSWPARCLSGRCDCARRSGGTARPAAAPAPDRASPAVAGCSR